ncbi:hypothetical protein [Cellulomonas sp. ATA003]|uniref:hypothetical protein n=1 Tax=Cellulomonas sp. ATA003 TaxID=3073064 RepID=UPI0028737321|nr:hypothetical protein [Cellulomonas sp. ATA003]WNB87045.1 hypothetical protein REH70_07905 [Cellulomonas sp. ATA003]
MAVRFMAQVTGLSPGDHVCWPFHGMAGLVPAAGDYVVEGLRRRERVTYCRLGPGGIRYGHVSDADEVGSSAAADAPVLVRLESDPAWQPSADPTEYLGSMVGAALADGYTGLRLLTDATDLAEDSARAPPGCARSTSSTGTARTTR